MKTLFEKNILIHFGLTDPQGILYFARLQELSHQLIEEFMAQTKLGWRGWFANPEFAVPIVHAESDFHSPMRAGQNFMAALLLEKKGESSITFTVQYNEVGTQKICASTRTVHVFVDKKNFQKIQIPELVQSLL